jgi:HEAT repeat protein
MSPNSAGTRIALCIAFLLGLSVCGYGQDSALTLDTAIAELRRVNIETFPEKEREGKAIKIDAAWKFLVANGEKASALLKQEIEKVDKANEKDNFFKLNATVVLWQIGKFAEAEYIAKVWESTPVERQYNYVFYTAFEAARTQDPRVLPMLRALLKDDKGSIYVGAHAMRVAWPLSHEFVWGRYGPAALPVLDEILERSNNEVEIKSAMYLLASAQYLPALPKIRRLATDARPEVRYRAVQSLGIFGHPADYEFLISGLSSNDPKLLFSHAFALYEFEDERAVKHLTPLLQNNNEQVHFETALALLHLLTHEAFVAVKTYAAKITRPELKEFIDNKIKRVESGLPKNFPMLSKDHQALALAKVRDENLKIGPADRPLTNAELISALGLWKSKGRIYNSGTNWVGEARAIQAAKPGDLNLILEAQSSFYSRLSDECLYEVRDLGRVIKYVGRSRYRKGLGVSPQAELK